MKSRVVMLICFLIFFAAHLEARKKPANILSDKNKGKKFWTLSDLTEKCPAEVRTRFYKSLFFVNGHLASVNTKGVGDCVDLNKMSVLGERLGKWERDNYNCQCNEYNRLGCKKEINWLCDPFFCSGDCAHSEKRRYSFREKYMGAEEIFARVPQEVASRFIGGLILDKGRVEKVTIGRDFLKYLGGEDIKEIISILMGWNWEVIRKAEIMEDYILKLQEESGLDSKLSKDLTKALTKKYDELFGSQKLKFEKYDDATLRKFWGIYKGLISLTLKKKYLPYAEAVFRNFRNRCFYGRNEMGDFDILTKELFSLYVELGNFPRARQLKQEFRGILETEMIPDKR